MKSTMFSLVTVVSTLVMAGCADETDGTRKGAGGADATGVTLEPGKTWALNPAAVQLNEAQVRSVTVNGEKLIVPTAANADLLADLKDGVSILISPSNPESLERNAGFMRKVLSRSVVGENTELLTKDVDLVEVIRGNLSSAIDKPILRTVDNGKGSIDVTKTSGTKMQGGADSAFNYAGFDFEPELKLDFGKYYYQKGLPALPDSSIAAAHFEIHPTLHIAPFVDFNVDVGVEWDWLNTHVELNRAKVALGLEYDAKVHLEAALYAKFGGSVIHKTILPPQVIMTGMLGPVPYVVSLDINLDCNLVAEAGISVHTVDPIHIYGTPTVGADYEKGRGWAGLESSAFNFNGGSFNLGIPDNWVPEGNLTGGAGIPLRAQGEYSCFVGPRVTIGTGAANLTILGHNVSTGLMAGASVGFAESVKGAACYTFNPLDIAKPNHGFSNITWGSSAELSIDVRANAVASFLGNNLASAEFIIFRQLLGQPAYGGSSSCLPK